MADTTTLIAFLRARLDEDEAVARAASGSDWDDMVPSQPFVIFGVEAYRKRKTQTTVGAVASVARAEDRAHIVRHDPARALREVETKRRIVDAYAEVAEFYRPDPDERYETADGHVAALHGAVRDLASIYGDHPDYREDWA